MLILSKTFEVVTHESAARNDAEERGYVWRDVPHTFRECVRELRDYSERSDSHGVPRWVTTEPQQNYRTGAETSYSLHPAEDARTLRYWARACKLAGLVGR